MNSNLPHLSFNSHTHSPVLPYIICHRALSGYQRRWSYFFVAIFYTSCMDFRPLSICESSLPLYLHILSATIYCWVNCVIPLFCPSLSCISVLEEGVRDTGDRCVIIFMVAESPWQSCFCSGEKVVKYGCEETTSNEEFTNYKWKKWVFPLYHKPFYTIL